MIKSNIVLIGMPNSGKSSVGKCLSRLLNKSFVDSDELISIAEGKSPKEIVIENGLQHFLKTQEQLILEINTEESVIATGGSVIYSEAAMMHLRKIGTIVFLNLDCLEVEKRINTVRKFAKNPGQTLAELYNERLPLYLKYADIVIDANAKSVEDIANEIINIQKGV